MNGVFLFKELIEGVEGLGVQLKENLLGQLILKFKYIETNN
tara:strand:+ start:275582 stop:275704 length:123 start_codon:yes stop_codon:yes gene_type:complete